MISDKTLENQLISRIYGNGRVWAFSKKDFASLGEPASIDRTLSRMAKKGLIRRVMRGLYDYPAYSKLLKKPLSPNIDQVAHALARKFGWQIQISGNAALNLMGLSTQVPTQYHYLSDGPTKCYTLGNTEIQFKKTRFTQLGLKHRHNEIVVQAVQALGDRPLTSEEQSKIRQYLRQASIGKAPEVDQSTAEAAGAEGVVTSANPDNLPEALVKRTLKDTQYVTSWIARNIRLLLLASEQENGNSETDVTTSNAGTRS